MFKTKLLILLLLNLLIISCSKRPDTFDRGYNLNYIGGGVDGLKYFNMLETYLKSASLLNPGSNLYIDTGIEHSQSLFITNINNTSDREKIVSKVYLYVNDSYQKCRIFSYEDEIEQFYLIALSEVFTSNQMAVDKIKDSNTEALIQNFFPKLINMSTVCIDAE